MSNNSIVHLEIYGRTALDIAMIGFIHRRTDLSVRDEFTAINQTSKMKVIPSMFEHHWWEDSIIMAENDEVCYVGNTNKHGVTKSMIRSAIKDLLKYLKMHYSEDIGLEFRRSVYDLDKDPITIKQFEHVFDLLKKPTYEGKVDDPFLLLKRRQLIKDFITFANFDAVRGNISAGISYNWSELKIFKFKEMISMKTPEMMKEVFVNYMKSITDKFVKNEKYKKEDYDMIMKIASCPEFEAFLNAVIELRSMDYNVNDLFENRYAYHFLLKETA